MSGFVALFNLDGAPVDAELLQQFTAYQSFRGPDAQQYWAVGPVGMGHALLRTNFEQATERQPCSLDNHVWIVGDIRLDGRVELLRFLRIERCLVANDAPDVELLLHAYHFWGEECLQKISGDFAFALWDGKQRRLLCARDQLGVVPLYYTQTGQTLIVSNTLNVCLLHPKVSDQLNEQVVADLILFGMNYEWETTIFEGVKRLPPAHKLISIDGKTYTERYWALPEENEYLHCRRKEEYVEQFLELFGQAVTDRIRADKVVAEMSGGLDSPSVVAFANEILNAKGKPFSLHTITYVTNRNVPAMTERQFAQAAAQFIGLQHHEIVEEYSTMTPVESPRYVPGAPSEIPTVESEAFMSTLAVNFRIVLTGQGGDSGLTCSSLYWRELLKHGQIIPLLRNIWWHVQLHHRLPLPWIRTTLGIPLYWRRQEPHMLDYPEFVNSELAERLQLRARYERIWKASYPGGRQRESVTVPFWTNVFAMYDPGHTGMCVKYHHPFFDLRLMRFLLAVPRVPWCVDKKLLRVAMTDRLPVALLERPKTAAGEVADFKPPVESLVWMLPLAREARLQPYLEQDRWLMALQNFAKLNSSQYHCVPQVLGLAYWFRHWRRPQCITGRIRNLPIGRTPDRVNMSYANT